MTTIYGFGDAGRRHRLVISMKAYKREPEQRLTSSQQPPARPRIEPEQADRKDTSIEKELLGRMDEWIGMLTDREGMIAATGRQRTTSEPANSGSIALLAVLGYSFHR